MGCLEKAIGKRGKSLDGLEDWRPSVGTVLGLQLVNRELWVIWGESLGGQYERRCYRQ